MRTEEQAVQVINPAGSGSVILVCEHASNHIPVELDDLGLSEDMLLSHNAWDPGALAIAERLSSQFDAPLVASCVSRLVYDCNRPPESPTAIVSNSADGEIPGNLHLSVSDREQRIAMAYTPFKSALQKTLSNQSMNKSSPVVITIHSFTPIYKTQKRKVEIGILHDQDSRLADAMLDSAQTSDSYIVRRNEPYSATDGVTHTLREHALPANLLNVMLEVRNDLLETQKSVDEISSFLFDLLSAGIEACQKARISDSRGVT